VEGHFPPLQARQRAHLRQRLAGRRQRRRADLIPTQSLYPTDSVPNLCRKINNALTRRLQISRAKLAGNNRHGQF